MTRTRGRRGVSLAIALAAIVSAALSPTARAARITTLATARTSTTASSGASTIVKSTSPPSPPPSGAFVAASPTGPQAPVGGWRVEYADAFGACLIDTATKCSAGYPRRDDTLGAATHANGAGNANEIAALEPFNADVTSSGLVLHCSQVSNLGDPDTCAAATGGASSSSPSPGAFHYTPTGGTHFVIEGKFQAPPNQGNMDPSFWTNGPNDVPEVDNPELWGMNHPVPAGATNTWCGYQFGFPAVPFDVGAKGNVQATFCSSPGANLDPSRGVHAWTLDMNGDTFTSYIDGARIGSMTYSPFNGASGVFKLLLMASMRKDAATGQDYPLPAGGNDLTFRSVAVYEPSSANNAGVSGGTPIIVPGTTVQ